MARRPTRTPVELASDIGAKAHDLYAYGDGQARAALAVVATVNPQMLAWLRDRLLDITKQPEIPAKADSKRAGTLDTPGPERERTDDVV